MNLELSEANIRYRCEQVAFGEYDFQGRLITCEQYLALTRLFNGLSSDDERDLLAGSLAAYGWMPTMMNELSARDSLKGLISDLRQAPVPDVAAVLRQHRAKGALQAVNNSIIGTSKVLHFFLPNKIAIWDSVLGRSFGMIHRHQFHREDPFISYQKAVLAVAASDSFPWERLNIAQGEGSADISRVRRIEFALYAFSRRHWRINSAESGSSPDL